MPILDPSATALALVLFAVNVAVPGSNFVWISRVSLEHGRTTGWHTSLGATFGDGLYVTAAVSGLSTVISGSQIAHLVIAATGGVWLAYLGVKTAMLFRSHGLRPSEALCSKLSFLQAFRSGLLVNLTNPQGFIFFAALTAISLPDVQNPGSGLLLVICFLLVSMLLRGSVAVLFSSSSIRSSYLRARRVIDLAAGSALFGIGLACASRALLQWDA